MRIAFTLAFAFGIVGASFQVEARSVQRWDRAYGETPSFARPINLARAPAGFIEFCENFADECAPDPGGANIIRLDEATFNVISAINASINQAIIEVSDQDHFNVADLWTLPDSGQGDCEDFQLLKRHELVARGFPKQALMMAVVRDENGEGHAVLIVRTDRGDLVLDNRTDMIRDWQSTTYEFIKRQSQEVPTTWVYIGNPADTLDSVASGGR